MSMLRNIHISLCGNAQCVVIVFHLADDKAIDMFIYFQAFIHFIFVYVNKSVFIQPFVFLTFFHKTHIFGGILYINYIK